MKRETIQKQKKTRIPCCINLSTIGIRSGGNKPGIEIGREIDKGLKAQLLIDIFIINSKRIIHTHPTPF